ncbi:MAG TPA: hypothetical protein VFI41_12810 [Gemmatimonadales bacterium]|nr:hypothetical protein [Gemmatimonadales bacterium]
MTLRIFSPATGRVYGTARDWPTARATMKELRQQGIPADIRQERDA